MLKVDASARADGDARMVDDMSFAVRPGRITGAVGATVAGRMTTVRIHEQTLVRTGTRMSFPEALRSTR